MNWRQTDRALNSKIYSHLYFAVIQKCLVVSIPVSLKTEGLTPEKGVQRNAVNWKWEERKEMSPRYLKIKKKKKLMDE